MSDDTTRALEAARALGLAEAPLFAVPETVGFGFLEKALYLASNTLTLYAIVFCPLTPVMVTL